MSNNRGLSQESSGSTPADSLGAGMKALRAGTEKSGERGAAPGGRNGPRAPAEERRGECALDQPVEQESSPKPMRAPAAAQSRIVAQEVPAVLETRNLRTASWSDNQLAEALCELRREDALGITDLVGGPVARWADMGEEERERWAQPAERLRELLEDVGKQVNSYGLCGHCSSISHEEDWELLTRDDDGQLIPTGPTDEHPIVRCPECGHDHIDDMWSGTHQEVTCERAGKLDQFPEYALVGSLARSSHARELS